MFSNEQYLSQINTNLLGTIAVTQAILPHFRERSAGKLVFIGSKNGWRGYAGIGAYAISKFALEGKSQQKIASFVVGKEILLM